MECFRAGEINFKSEGVGKYMLIGENLSFQVYGLMIVCGSSIRIAVALTLLKLL